MACTSHTGHAVPRRRPGSGSPPARRLARGLAAGLLAGSAWLLPAGAGANDAPAVRITSPPDCGLVAPVGNFEVEVEAAVEDPDGSIAVVRFHSSFGELCGVDSIPPYTARCRLVILVENARTGPARTLDGAGGECACSISSYQPATLIHAVAVDDQGATASSDTIRVRPWWPGGATPGTALVLADPDFESVTLADGGAATGPGTIGGWTFEGTAGASLGVLNPTAASYPGAEGAGTPAGAGGANIAFLAVPGGGADSAHAFQALPDTLRHWSRYWLEVAAGWPLDATPEAGSPFEGARFELRAGSTVIVQSTCTAVWQQGEFFDLLGLVVTDLLPPSLIGQPLSLHAWLGAEAAPRTVHFDRLRLRREPYRQPGVDVPTGPARAGLFARAVPNPAFAAGAIEFTLERDERVTLTVLDPAGRTVRGPASLRLRAGPQRLPLPPDLPAGLYFARIEAGAEQAGVRFVRLAR
jgi:hypothetical protein